MGKANITIAHPSSDGSGSALRAEMFYQTDERPAFVRLSFASQSGESFDFSDAMRCDLSFDSLSKAILILRGDAESTEKGNPIPLPGGVFFAMKRTDGGVMLAAMTESLGARRNVGIVLLPHEADGLRLALEQTMFFVSFIKAVNP